MANRLADGVDWLAGALKDHAGTAVVYRRGHLTVSVTALRPPPDRRTFEESGFRTDAESCFFHFEAADLVLGGETIKPDQGDEIEIGSGADREVFAVLPPDVATPSFVSLDGASTMITVHAKKID